MVNQTFKRRSIVFVGMFAVIALAVTAGVFSARRQPQNQKTQKKVLALPTVISHVPELQIASVSVKNLGTPDASAIVEILNTSPLAVMVVEISTKNKEGDSGAVNSDGLFDPDKPQVVIPPFGTTKIEMTFSAMVPDAPLVVSAAVFSDGTEEGDQWSRDAIRAVRANRQAQERAEKEKKQSGGDRP